MATLVSFTIKGFTAEGHEAAFDFTAESDNVQAEMVSAANQMWLAGLYPTRPDWLQRHDFEVCDTVLIREHESDDGRRTPVAVMYAAAPYLNLKFLHEYLNSDAEIRAFEELIGRSLKDFPRYNSAIAPERGKKPSEAQYFVKVRPFGVLKRIPAAGDDSETREKHRLVRFIPITAAPPPAIDASKARADLGGGQQPRVMGRNEQTPSTPAQIIDAALDLGNVNPYGDTGKPATQQPQIDNAETAEAIVESVFVQQNRDGVVSYVLQPANVIIYTRDPLRACDVPCEDWQPGEQKHILANKLRVKYTIDGTAKKFVALERAA